MVSLLAIGFVAVASAILYWYKWRRHAQTLLARNNIPGPTPHFIFGNFAEIRGKNVPTVSERHKKYGKIYGSYIGAKPVVAVMDTELLKLIQIKDFHLFSSRPQFIKGGLDASKKRDAMLIDQHGQRWKEVRSILTPTFNASKMKATVPLINDAIDAMLEIVEEKSAGGANEFNIYDLFQGLTMDTIGRSAFGIRTEVQRNPDDEFFKATKSIFSDQLANPVNILLAVNLFFVEFTAVLYPMRWALARVVEFLGLSTEGILYDYCEKVVAARRKNIDDPKNPWSRIDLLQKMLEAKLTGDQMKSLDTSDKLAASADMNSGDAIEDQAPEPSKTVSKKMHYMTKDEVVSNAVLFFEAGYETTSTALGFVAHFLVNHQDVQDRVREELNDLFEREGRFDYNTVTELQYMEAVLFETMRIFPPITQFVSRMSSTDYKYKDITIPKDASVSVSVYDLHHSPELWNEPEVFNPERFYGANKGKINPIAWQPFGNGPRNCIGMRFAVLEAKMALARLLQKYKLEPGPNTELKGLEVSYKPISMCPKNGVIVRAVPIN